MTPFSKALSGILLPHKTFGTYLHSSRNTIDINLEECTFNAAGEVLAKVWEEIILDNFSVVAGYIKMLQKIL